MRTALRQADDRTRRYRESLILPFNRPENRLVPRETKLLLVILEDALGVLWLTRHLQPMSRPKRQPGEAWTHFMCKVRRWRKWEAREETIDWFKSEERSYVFAFGSICDVLGFDDCTIRRSLEANNWIPVISPFSIGSPCSMAIGLF